MSEIHTQFNSPVSQPRFTRSGMRWAGVPGIVVTGLNARGLTASKPWRCMEQLHRILLGAAAEVGLPFSIQLDDNDLGHLADPAPAALREAKVTIDDIC